MYDYRTEINMDMYENPIGTDAVTSYSYPLLVYTLLGCAMQRNRGTNPECWLCCD